jgi:hypothetical protein
MAHVCEVVRELSLTDLCSFPLPEFKDGHNRRNIPFCSSQRMPIDKIAMEETREGAVFPGYE